MMVSSAGKAIMWDEGEARAMGRDTMGVRGMTVAPGVRVLGMEIAKPGTELFVITEKGYGKRTPISEYPEHHRGGQGVFTITMTEKKGLLAAMKIVRSTDELMIISEEGIVVRTGCMGISQLGRSTQGVRVMNVAENDKVTAVAISGDGKKRKANKSVDEPETIVDPEEAAKSALIGEFSEDDIDDDFDDDAPLDAADASDAGEGEDATDDSEAEDDE
ncbi:MAG: DNA gyrase C-terminal beta-propeller domain-containing protein, partial [Raoultibacter sp.]